MTPISEMHKLGWIQIDPAKPINEQVSVGDYVISTEMFIYDEKEKTFVMEEFEEFKENFRVVFIDDLGITLRKDARDFGLDSGEAHLGIRSDIKYTNDLFFVLKSIINYINVKVPDFILEEVKQLGGIELDDLRDMDLSHCLDIGITD